MSFFKVFLLFFLTKKALQATFTRAYKATVLTKGDLLSSWNLLSQRDLPEEVLTKGDLLSSWNDGGDYPAYSYVLTKGDLLSSWN